MWVCTNSPGPPPSPQSLSWRITISGDGQCDDVPALSTGCELHRALRGETIAACRVKAPRGSHQADATLLYKVRKGHSNSRDFPCHPNDQSKVMNHQPPLLVAQFASIGRNLIAC